MKKFNNRLAKIAFGVLLLCIILTGFLYFNGNLGLPKSRLESDVRSSQKIETDWTVEGNVSGTMAAFISYPPNMTGHIFSVYVNRPGLSFGYFFRGGGSIFEVEESIAEFTLEGYNERAFISMNKLNVERLEIDDGNSIQVMDLDSRKPFALILPVNAGNITFYDVHGAVVDFLEYSL